MCNSGALIPTGPHQLVVTQVASLQGNPGVRKDTVFIHKPWAGDLSRSQMSCVAMEKSVYLLEPSFSHLQYEELDLINGFQTTYFILEKAKSFWQMKSYADSQHTKQIDTGRATLFGTRAGFGGGESSPTY